MSNANNANHEKFFNEVENNLGKTSKFSGETDKDRLDELSAKLNEQIIKVGELEAKVNNQIQEVSALKTQMFGVVGFLITIFTFISAATDFYKPILDLVKMFSIDMLAQHSFNSLNFIIDLMFLALPILFIYVTFKCASRFFTKMAK